MLSVLRPLVTLAVICGLGSSGLYGLEDRTRSSASSDTEAQAVAAQTDKLIPLTKSETVLLDRKGKRILLKTKVVLREGMLEMLVCKKQTKEHESILAVDAPAFVIHSGLLAIGAKPGAPVSYVDGEIKPPTGQRIDVFLQWTDEEGKLHREPAQNWIRHVTHRYYVEKLKSPPPDFAIPEKSDLRYDARHKELIWYGPMSEKQRDEFLTYSKDKEYQQAIRKVFEQGRSRPMKAHWVFAGSTFYVEPDEQGREVRHYQAEGGDVVCVANFPSAMLDVSIESSATGEQNLLFEAWTERIPPVETEVTVELVPVFEKDKDSGAKPPASEKR